MMNRTVKVSDCVSRQIAIDLIKSWSGGYDYIEIPTDAAIKSFELLPSAHPEITEEQVKEFCEELGFIVLTSDEYHWLKSLKSKAEEYRWNGGGNY